MHWRSSLSKEEGQATCSLSHSCYELCILVVKHFVWCKTDHIFQSICCALLCCIFRTVEFHGFVIVSSELVFVLSHVESRYSPDIVLYSLILCSGLGNRYTFFHWDVLKGHIRTWSCFRVRVLLILFWVVNYYVWFMVLMSLSKILLLPGL